MPINPRQRWFYPIDWLQLSAAIRFKRAKGRCEACRRPHGKLVCHLGDGRWWDPEVSMWRDGQGRAVPDLSPLGFWKEPILTTRVFLACAHLDHDPTNNRARNLAALCQRCHMLHDRAEHQRSRWLTLFRRRAMGDLYLGPYR